MGVALWLKQHNLAVEVTMYDWEGRAILGRCALKFDPNSEVTALIFNGRSLYELCYLKIKGEICVSLAIVVH